MACECLDKTDEALKEHNLKLGVALSLSGKPHKAVVQTAFIEKRRGQRPGFLVATYCPFCGVSYE